MAGSGVGISMKGAVILVISLRGVNFGSQGVLGKTSSDVAVNVLFRFSQEEIQKQYI